MSVNIPLIVLLIGVFCIPCPLVSADELMTTSQDIFPKYFMVKKNGKIQMGGMMVDMIDEMNKHLHRAKIVNNNQFTPWKRIIKQLETGEIDLFFGIAKKPEREKEFIYLHPPVINVHTVFCIRSDDDIHLWNFEDILLLNGDRRILAQFGSSNAAWARKMGAPLGLEIDDSGKNTEINLLKLINNRGRVYIHHDLAIISAIRKDHLQNKVKVLPAKLRTFGHYIALSKNVPQEIIAEVQDAFKTMVKTGKLAEIQNAYHD